MSALIESQAAAQRRVITINLQKIPLLSGVDEKTLTEMSKALQLRNFEKGAQVVQKGGPGDFLYFVLAGRLQAIDLTEGGQQVGLNFISTGEYFGELSIVDGLPRSASVLACENSLVAMLPRVQAIALISQNPLISERVLRRMASAVRAASNYRAILGISNAFQRVFALLNQFAKVAPGGLVVIEQMPTQQEIAVTVNTSRETVSRAIHILIQKGIVEKDIRRLIVRMPDALRKAVTQDIDSAD